MNETEVQALIEAAIAPLRDEIQRLQEQLGIEGSNPTSNQTKTAAPTELGTSPTTEISAVTNIATSIPEGRSDFARFIQRGLEQEAQRPSETEDANPATKKTWNPFKR